MCVGDIRCGEVDNLVKVAVAEEESCNRETPVTLPLTAKLPLNAEILLTFKALSRRAAAAAVVPPAAARVLEGKTGASFTGFETTQHLSLYLSFPHYVTQPYVMTNRR